MSAERIVELAPCECCGIKVPYWELDSVEVLLPYKRVHRHLRLVEPHTIVRLECRDCRGQTDG